LFPTAGGDGEECERMKMIHVLRPLIESGRIKVYSADSTAGKVLTSKDRTPSEFSRAQCRMDAMIYHELIPWIRADCKSDDIEVVVAGASIGAFNAVAAICRHPDVFRTAIGMSGTYDISKWLDGPLGLDFYFSSPIHFLPKLEGPQLEQLRRRMILLPTGTGDYEDPAESFRMATILGDKRIPNRVDPWGSNYRHDWPTWRAMLPKYLADLVD
jgi:esterase/lipase superfamily enzyme